MSTDSDSRIVVITGVTRGLGRALAEFFLERGLTVCGCGRSQQALAELQRACERASRRGHFTAVNVASDRAVAHWAHVVSKEVGVPDILINNAAVIAPPAFLWQVPAHVFDLCLDINVKGTANVIRHFVPAMVRRRTGVIVNISSGWGRSVAPRVAPYCATKWAIEGLTKALAQELPPGMAAVAVNPGVINTDMLRSCFGDEAATYPSPSEWVRKAGPFFLKLGPRDNGRSLTAP